MPRQKLASATAKPTIAKINTRQAILMAAIDLMGQGGIEAVSASALAREVGVSKATIFHHFTSIDDIPVAAFDLLAAEQLGLAASDTGNPLSTPDGMTVEQLVIMLQQMGERAIEMTKSHRGFFAAYFSFITRALFDPALNNRIRISLESWRDQVRDLIVDAGMSPQQAHAQATLIFATMDGLLLQLMMLGNEADVRAGWTQFIDQLSQEFTHAYCD